MQQKLIFIKLIENFNYGTKCLELIVSGLNVIKMVVWETKYLYLIIRECKVSELNNWWVKCDKSGFEDIECV